MVPVGLMLQVAAWYTQYYFQLLMVTGFISPKDSILAVTPLHYLKGCQCTEASQLRIRHGRHEMRSNILQYGQLLIYGWTHLLVLKVSS